MISKDWQNKNKPNKQCFLKRGKKMVGGAAAFTTFPSLPGPLDRQQSPNVVWTGELQTVSPKKPQVTHGGGASCYKYSVAKSDVMPFRQGLPHEARRASSTEQCRRSESHGPRKTSLGWGVLALVPTALTGVSLAEVHLQICKKNFLNILYLLNSFLEKKESLHCGRGAGKQLSQ